MTTPTTGFLSTQRIPVRERLILALDVPAVAEAKAWVERLGSAVEFYKLGLELFMSGRYDEAVDHLRRRGKRVMVDLKFFDIPQTVAAAVRQLRGRGIDFVTVHGNDGILEAACSEAGDGMEILAVTVLTSLDEGDMRALGFRASIEEVVLSRARRALELGCGGVVSSGLEARALRESHGEGFLVVCPGVRPGSNRVATEDQKRSVGVEEAFRNGADHIVIGRPIRNAPDPVAAAEEIQRQIAALFPERAGQKMK